MYNIPRSFEGEQYRPNNYVYVNGEVRNESQIWVGKILEIVDNKVRLQWATNPVHLPDRLQWKHKFASNELLMTFGPEDQDTVDLDTLAGLADVEECCQSLVALGDRAFGWNRFIHKGEITRVCEAVSQISDDEYDSETVGLPA
jgi:hypothetical protein